jgi:hypothetical protein
MKRILHLNSHKRYMLAFTPSIYFCNCKNTMTFMSTFLVLVDVLVEEKAGLTPKPKATNTKKGLYILPALP